MEHGPPIARPRIDPTITPFVETVAFRRYGPVPDPDVDAPEDVYLKALIQEQGFDGLPHLVSRLDLDHFIAAGERELFRGVIYTEYTDAFRVGDFFVGRGIYGDGANAAAGRHAMAIAREYAEGGPLLRLTLRAGVRIADFDALEALAQRERAAALDRIHQAEAMDVARVGGAMTDAIRARHRAARSAAHAQYDDIGRLAAYLGYDAVHAADVSSTPS